MSNNYSDGYFEAEASRMHDKSDSSRLSNQEVKQSFGSNSSFFQSYGLKPWDAGDMQQAVDMSRQMKANDSYQKSQGQGGSGYFKK